jgi:hypothetical protein
MMEDKKAQRMDFSVKVRAAAKDFNISLSFTPSLPLAGCSTSLLISLLQFYGKRMLTDESIQKLSG